MLLPDFIVSWVLQCNVILHCITSCTLEHVYLQCSSMFSLVCLLYFFSDAAYSERGYHVEIVVERSIFECNIFKKAFQDFSWVELKIFSCTDIQYTRVELKIFSDKDIQYTRAELNIFSDKDIQYTWAELQIFSYKDIQYTRAELKIFTRFAFKLVFRVSGRSVPWDKPPTSKRTGVHNLHVIFKCCL